MPNLHTGNKPNFSKFFREFSAINCRSTPRFMCLQNVVWMPQNMCQLLQQISECINGCTITLKTMPNFPKNPHSILSQFICQERTVRNCTEFVRYELSTAVVPPRNLCQSTIVQTDKIRTVLTEINFVCCLDFYAHK
jgi:hypothetical protein